MNTIHQLSRFSVEIRNPEIRIKTRRGVFHFGVDNEGVPYISAATKRLVIVPNSSNRMNFYEEDK